MYGRVSTGHQVEQQTIEQQIERLTALVATHATEGWTLEPAHVFRDDGYSGASLARPGLDRLRDAIKGREVDRVLVTAPDRLARNYVHQMVLLEEWTRAGCTTEFLERPMSDDPHDNLLLQIRGKRRAGSTLSLARGECDTRPRMAGGPAQRGCGWLYD